MRLAGLIAAAGASTRLGFPKLLLALDDEPLVLLWEHSMRRAGVGTVAATVPPAHLIADSDARDCAALCDRLRARGVHLLDNSFWAEGLIGTVKSALECFSNIDALVLTPVDVPCPDASLIAALIADESREVCFPQAAQERGHPIVLRSSSFSAVQEYRGSGGLESLFAIASLPGVSWPDPACAQRIQSANALANSRISCWRAPPAH